MLLQKVVLRTVDTVTTLIGAAVGLAVTLPFRAHRHRRVAAASYLTWPPSSTWGGTTAVAFTTLGICVGPRRRQRHGIDDAGGTAIVVVMSWLLLSGTHRGPDHRSGTLALVKWRSAVDWWDADARYPQLRNDGDVSPAIHR